MKQIDLKDKKILYQLDRDSSQTNKQIARKVKLSEMTTSNKIKRLISLNIVDNFYVKTNPSYLGYTHIKVYLRLHNITKAKETEIINHLKKQKAIFWLSTLRGKYDIVLSIYVKSIFEFSQKYHELFLKYQEFILDRNVIVLESASSFTKAYLLPRQESEEIIYSEGESLHEHSKSHQKRVGARVGKTQTKIDKKDEELLKILSKNARESFVNIATKLKASADTVKYRIKNLEKKGIITGFSTKINFNKLNNSYHLIFLKLHNMTSQKFSKMKTFTKTNKNIVVYIKTIGDHEVELEVETSNKEELDKLIKDLRDNFSNEIKDYDLLEVTEEHLLNYYNF